MTLKPGIHFGVPREAYEADPGINQSTLKKFAAAKTPYHFKFERDNPKPEDKDFLRIGTALDTLIWSPSEFKDRIAIAPETYPAEPKKKGEPPVEKPWTLQSNWCKDWWTAAIACKKTPLLEKERQQVKGMLGGLMAHEDVPAILDNCERHAVIIANHPTLGYRMKGELDLWPSAHSQELGRWYFELKSDGEGADDPSFHDKCWRIGYVKQISFYLMLARFIGFEDMHSCGVIAIESFPPYQCKVHYSHWDDEEVAKERKWIEEWMPRYMACVEKDEWPSYPKSWSRIRYPKPWMLKDKEQQEGDVLQ